MNPVNKYLLDSSYVLGIVVDFGRLALNKSKFQPSGACVLVARQIKAVKK